MRPRSSLTEHQQEQLVELFEQGLSYRASANRISVNHRPVKKLHLR